MRLCRLASVWVGVAAFSCTALGGASKQVTDPEGVWRVSAPSDWTTQSAGRMTMVSSPNSRANVVIFAGPLEPGTAEQWLQSLAAVLQQQVPGWKLVGSEPLTVSGRPALLASATSATQGVPMHAYYLLLKSERHQVMLSCNCPQAELAAYQDTFARLMASLQVPAGAGSAPAPSPAPRPVPVPPPSTQAVRWENYVSKHLTFTLLKPAGWSVDEFWQQDPPAWAFTVVAPNGLYEVANFHGAVPVANDGLAAARWFVADLSQRTVNLQLAPTARCRTAGKKMTLVFDGTYVARNGQKRQLRCLVSAGEGLLLTQRLDAPDGQLAQIAPVLLQTLANLRVAKNVFAFDEGSVAAARQAGPQPVQVPPFVPRALAGGWGGYTAPANWQQVDLGKGQVIACDPTQQAYFVAATCDFMTPRYAHLVRLPGMLVSDFCRPHQALATACVKQGHGTNFRFEVTDRPDLVQQMRAGITGGRPCSVEHFVYTFNRQGTPYKGFSLGWCVGNYMDAGFGLGHLTIWAPAAQFDAWLPVLAQVMTSYRLNQEKVGEYIADGLRRYYEGIRRVSAQIAANSEQMRRENLALHMERGRVQDYTSYLTTRMIMGEYDYLAGASGYVRGDPSGLYTADGNRITSEPYGESVTRHMQEINTRQLFEQVRPR
ncbi:MAG TPA: DcrB-related protein [Planctomycetota bacterium]|nr:DcrB-related protein [Planctomycetota bacterium]HRR79792.1 DcrB-related protein [Planctomycetota bacterium]HRT95812.1 DcrB-related protein [Planctomycetota bacterium]